MKMEAQIRIRQTGKCDEIPEDQYVYLITKIRQTIQNEKNIPRIHIITSTDSSSYTRM